MFWSTKTTCPGKRGRMVAVRNSGASARCKTVGAWNWTHLHPHINLAQSSRTRSKPRVRPLSWPVTARHMNPAMTNYRKFGPNTMHRQRTQPTVEWVPGCAVSRLRMHGAKPPLFHVFSRTHAELSTATILKSSKTTDIWRCFQNSFRYSTVHEDVQEMLAVTWHLTMNIRAALLTRRKHFTHVYKRSTNWAIHADLSYKHLHVRNKCLNYRYARSNKDRGTRGIKVSINKAH